MTELATPQDRAIAEALYLVVVRAREAVTWCPASHPELDDRVAALVGANGRLADGDPHPLAQADYGAALNDLLQAADATTIGCRFDHTALADALGQLRALLRQWEATR